MTLAIDKLPVIQRWSCSGCGNCCREHFVEVRPEEMERIAAQGWSQQPGFEGRPLFVPYHGPFWNRTYRLAHQPDGSCIFLDPDGRCRIHARFGERAKPVACRLFPFVLVPTGRGVQVSLRFSCPSAVRNVGRAVPERAKELRRLLRDVAGRHAGSPPPPPIHGRQQLDWDDTLRVARTLQQVVSGAGPDWPRRLLRALELVRIIGQARFEKVRGRRLEQFLELVRDAVGQLELPEPEQIGRPSRKAGVLHRLTVAQYARKDVSPQLWSGLRGRWSLLRAATRFARGRGSVPPLQLPFGSPDFEAVERPFGPLPDAAWELVDRYFQVKLAGMHFCGRPYYDYCLADGFFALAQTYPVLMWLARWRAAGAGRLRLTFDDLATALTILDHNYGYNPAFGMFYARARLRMLVRGREMDRLIAWYSR